MKRNEAVKSIVDFVNSHNVCSNAEFIDNGVETYVLYDLTTKYGVERLRINVYDVTSDDNTCYLSTHDDDELFLNNRFYYDWDEKSTEQHNKMLKIGAEDGDGLWSLFGFSDK